MGGRTPVLESSFTTSAHRSSPVLQIHEDTGGIPYPFGRGFDVVVTEMAVAQPPVDDPPQPPCDLMEVVVHACAAVETSAMCRRVRLTRFAAGLRPNRPLLVFWQ